MYRDEPWTFLYVIEALDRWAEREKPSQDLRVTVTEWAFNRHTDPYQGMKRVKGFDNLWFGEVRGTRFHGTTVTRTYLIDEAQRRVRFENFTTLNLPI